MSSDYLPCWVAFVLFLYFDGLSLKVRFRFMVFNATFNNISVISWWSIY